MTTNTNLYAGNNIGDIDESGFIKNLFRKGFTLAKCILEIHGNSIDANAQNIKYNILRQTIRIADDGNGMDMQQVKNAFSMYRSNHAHDKSIGVSGIGLKAGTAVLGNKQPITIITHKTNGIYITVKIPWDDIYKEGRYSKMVTTSESTDEEIKQFTEERKDTKISGTTIIFPCTDELKNTIQQQFKTSQECKDPDIDIPFDFKNQLCVVFGHSIPNVSLDCYDINETTYLTKYNYFNALSTDFYEGIEQSTITCYVSNNTNNEPNIRYILTDRYGDTFEIPKKGKGYGIKPQESKNLNGYTACGNFIVKCAIRKDMKYFDYNNPIIPTGTSGLDPYDMQHIGAHNFEALSKISIVRNNQFIGTSGNIGVKISSARGNGESMNKVYRTHVQLSYEPISTNDNIQDILMIGVQEVKTPDADFTLPIALSRLIIHCKNEKAKSVWNHFNDICNVNEEEVKKEEVKKEEIEKEEIEKKEIEKEEVEKEEIEKDEVEKDEVEVEENEVEVEENEVEENEDEVEVEENEVEVEENEVEVEEQIVVKMKRKQVVNVSPYRRNGFDGYEQIDIFIKLSQIYTPDDRYNSPEYNTMFNDSKKLLEKLTNKKI